MELILSPTVPILDILLPPPISFPIISSPHLTRAQRSFNSQIHAKMNNSRRLKLRSRTGCDRCRTRHQKCDELQPQCSRCFEADVSCAYGKHELRRHHMPYSSAFFLLPPPSSRVFRLFPSLSSSHSLFLSYYVHEASAAISCNEGIQHDTCNAVISVGSTFPSLLYASLLFSAMHKSSRMHDATRSTMGQSIQIPVLQLRSAALSSLRSQVCQAFTPNKEAIVATILMLATCELRYDPETSVWRQHFEYARYLLSQFPAQYRPGDEALWRFIQRRIAVIEFLLSLPTSWPRLPRMYFPTYPTNLPCLQTVGIIDGTMACSMELLDVFRWIGALEEMKHQLPGMPQLKPQNYTDYSQQVSAKLVSFVQQMMARDSRTPPMMSDELQGPPTDTHLEDYRVCNNIAQHVSLICLYRYGLGWDRKDPSVANSVRSIIELASSITMHAGSHPSICLSTALFIAGQEAEHECEDDIRKLLKIQYLTTKSQNTQKALDILHRTWSAVPSPYDISKKDKSLGGM